MHDRALERREEFRRGLRRHRADHAARHQKAEGMDRIARIGHQHDVARRGDRLRHVGEAFLGAERGDDLGLGIELHAEAALVIGGLRAAQARDALRGRIAVGARLAERLLELFDDMGRRRQIRIAHAEIDDVGARIARRRLGAVDLLEHVGRQTADAVKFFHDPSSLRPRAAASLLALAQFLTRTAAGKFGRPAFYHGLRTLAAGLPVGQRLPTRSRAAARSASSFLCSSSVSGVLARRRHVVHGRIGRRIGRPLRRTLRQAAGHARHMVGDDGAPSSRQESSAPASSSATAMAPRRARSAMNAYVDIDIEHGRDFCRIAADLADRPALPFDPAKLTANSSNCRQS